MILTHILPLHLIIFLSSNSIQKNHWEAYIRSSCPKNMQRNLKVDYHPWRVLPSFSLAKCTDLSAELVPSIIRVDEYTRRVMMGTNNPVAAKVGISSNPTSSAQSTTASHRIPPSVRWIEPTPWCSDFLRSVSIQVPDKRCSYVSEKYDLYRNDV